MERLLEIGQVVCDTYVVEELIGTGASSEVYRVKHRYLPGNQAMKVFKEIKISPHLPNLPSDEAQILREIECPNVIRVLDANIVETSRGLRFFFTMDYVSGGTVQDYWYAHNKHRMDVSNIVEILRQACRGIAAAHRANPPIVHRDIKPHNLLIEFGETGLHVRVCDFSLSDRADSPSIQTDIVGALIYKPPEVVYRHSFDSCEGDVWALGVLLYFLLTDRYPYAVPLEFKIRDMGRVPRTVFWRSPQPPSETNSQVNAELDRIAMRAVVVNPQERYATAEELLKDLERWRFSPNVLTGKNVNQNFDELANTNR